MRNATLLALLLCAACKSHAPAAGEKGPGNALPFETLVQGYQSGVHTADALLVVDEQHWAELWKRHANWRIPAASAPAVDFKKHSVLAVFAGDRPSGGYGLEVRWIAPEKDVLSVRAHVKAPAPGALVPMSLTQPYHFVLLPRVSGATVLKLD